MPALHRPRPRTFVRAIVLATALPLVLAVAPAAVADPSRRRQRRSRGPPARRGRSATRSGTPCGTPPPCPATTRTVSTPVASRSTTATGRWTSSVSWAIPSTRPGRGSSTSARSTRPARRPGAPDASGTWVWIDHGGGVVSRYHHLDSVAVAEGALVTPSTQIGAMGHSGDFAPCTTNYLHFEVRTGGVKGTRVDPGQLWGCLGTSRESYPAAFGYSSWNDVPKVSEWTPALDNGCLPTSTTTSSAPAAISGRRGDESARITWTARHRGPAPSRTTSSRRNCGRRAWGPGTRRPTGRCPPRNWQRP